MSLMCQECGYEMQSGYGYAGGRGELGVYFCCDNCGYFTRYEESHLDMKEDKDAAEVLRHAQQICEDNVNGRGKDEGG